MALNFPDSPSPGSTYSAPNGVLYTWDNTLGVWTAELDTPLPPFLILNPGTISGTPAIANVLTYTQGVAGGGVAPLSYSWNWKDDLGNILQSGGTSYTVAQGDFGKTIEVELSATDSATTPVTVTGTTTSTVTVFRNSFPSSTWNPAGSLAENPGLLSGTYNGVGPNLTTSGCIEAAVATPPAIPSAFSTGTQPIANGQVLAVRWASTLPCGLAPSGTFIQGSVTDETFENSYSLLVDRVPDPIPNMSDSDVPLGGSVSQQISVPVSGINTTAYVTYEAASTGTSITASLDGVSYFNLPTSGQEFSVNNGDTLHIKQTVGTTISTGYTAIIRIGDGTNTAGTYTEFTYTATTTNNASFPNYNPLPSYAPNASPEGLSIVDTGSLGPLDGKTSGVWGDGTNLVTGTNMLLSIGAGAFASSVTPSDGNTVNIAWDPSYIDGLADQSIASGSITDGVYTNTYAFTVEKNPVYNIPADSDSLAVGATATIPFSIPNNYNSPVPFYYTPGTDTMLNVQVDINGSGLQSLPSSLGTALTLTPGDTVEIYADLGPNPSTVYSITINMGAFSGLWSETTQALPSIAQPTLVAPVNSPPDLLNPAINDPSGITLVSSAYSAANGAGAQTTSTYEVYEGGLAATVESTNTISTVATVTPTTGSPVGGGYFAGQISTAGDGVADFNLIVAPKATGENSSVQYKTSNTADANPNSQDVVYGKLATDQFNDADHPAFQWAKGLTIGGYNDWYIPAKNELEILFFNLKPTIANNSTGGNGNPNAVPPRGGYTTGTPAQTTNPLFQSGGSEAFTSSPYGSSSEYAPTPTQRWIQVFSGGAQNSNDKISFVANRAIRRVPVATPLTQTLTIAGANTDGFALGQKVQGSSSGATGVITAINGTSVTVRLVSGAFTTSDKLKGNGTPLTGSPYSGTTPTPPTDPSVFISADDLTPSENYFWRAQYATNTPSAITSPWSTWNQFDTDATFSIPIGTPMEGGYFAGQIVGAGSTTGGGLDDLGVIYNLIVSPITSSTLEGQYGGVTPQTITYKNTSSNDGGSTLDLNYGSPATTDFADADHPMFNWCVNGVNGPNSGTFDATNTAGTGIGGYNDWYIPARNELAILYFFLKPGTGTNSTTSGSNSNSVDPYTQNTNYGPGFPDQTISTLFQAGGAQVFTSLDQYWSSTEVVGNDFSAWAQKFGSGEWISGTKNQDFYARAIRRITA